jgi:hypothetical protein
MGNIGDSITPSVPSVGATGPGYATDINAILTEVVARLSAKVPFSSLSNNSNLDLNGQSLLNAAYVTLVNESVSPVASPANRATSYSGDFWWVSPSGAVQITTGNKLNASSIAGINGDYGGVNPASVYFDSATAQYRFYSNFSTSTWGELRARKLNIAAGATSSVSATLAFGGSSNYTLTLPAAVPATQKLVQMDASGNLTASGTLASGEHITLQGTGDYKHGDKKLCWSPTSGNVTCTVGTYVTGTGGDEPSWTLSAAGVVYFLDFRFKVGDRIKSIQLYETDAGTASTYLTTIGSGTRATTNTTPGGFQTVLTLNTPYTITGTNNVDSVISLKITAGSGDANFLKGLIVTYDRP